MSSKIISHSKNAPTSVNVTFDSSAFSIEHDTSLPAFSSTTYVQDTSSSLSAQILLSTREKLLGICLATISFAIYSTYAMFIKMVMKSYQMTVPEITYYISVFQMVMFYYFARQQKVDIFNVPKETQFDLFLRSVFGILSDVLLFVSFQYTSLSKAFCLFIM